MRVSFGLAVLLTLFAACTSVQKSPAPANDELSAVAPLSAEDRLELNCESGYAIVMSRANPSLITFRKGETATVAKQNAIEECRHNEGKFLCFRVNENTMINLPINLKALNRGDQAKLEINDDVDNVTGNGQAFSCLVN